MDWAEQAGCLAQFLRLPAVSLLSALAPRFAASEPHRLFQKKEQDSNHLTLAGQTKSWYLPMKEKPESDSHGTHFVLAC